MPRRVLRYINSERRTFFEAISLATSIVDKNLISLRVLVREAKL